jgi:hypothetical protein
LGRAVRDNPSLPSCLVTRIYAYATGRKAADGEADWVHWLNDRFASQGYRLPDLMRAIATSDAFYRVTPAAAAPSATASSGEYGK